MVKASRPPMGWNSWDSYGTTVTEDEVLANAEFMATNLKTNGWDTVVVDIDWYDPTARAHGYNAGAPLLLDDFGRQLPVPERFPSSTDGKGFAPLAARIHELGLKFGVHIMRGIPRLAVERDCPVYGTEWTASQVVDKAHTCTWNPDNYGLNHQHPGAQAWYDSQLDLLVGWGIDFIKVDDMQNPFYEEEIAAYSHAIEKAEKKYGREVMLSLSPGVSSTNYASFLQKYAQMWRVSDDLWDRWSDIYAQFARMSDWASYQQPGHWADADMLPLGRIGIRAENGDDRLSNLTDDEQKTMLTLWSMARSPLMMGGDLPTSPQKTISLLQNPALFEVSAHTTNNREVMRDATRYPWDGTVNEDPGEVIVWTADTDPSDLHPGRIYAAFFWTGEQTHDISLRLSTVIGLNHADTDWAITNLWESDQIPRISGKGNFRDINVSIHSHGTVWIALDPVNEK